MLFKHLIFAILLTKNRVPNIRKSTDKATQTMFFTIYNNSQTLRLFFLIVFFAIFISCEQKQKAGVKYLDFSPQLQQSSNSPTFRPNKTIPIDLQLNNKLIEGSEINYSIILIPLQGEILLYLDDNRILPRVPITYISSLNNDLIPLTLSSSTEGVVKFKLIICAEDQLTKEVEWESKCSTPNYTITLDLPDTLEVDRSISISTEIKNDANTQLKLSGDYTIGEGQLSISFGDQNCEITADNFIDVKADKAIITMTPTSIGDISITLKLADSAGLSYDYTFSTIAKAPKFNLSLKRVNDNLLYEYGVVDLLVNIDPLNHPLNHLFSVYNDTLLVKDVALTTNLQLPLSSSGSFSSNIKVVSQLYNNSTTAKFSCEVLPTSLSLLTVPSLSAPIPVTLNISKEITTTIKHLADDITYKLSYQILSGKGKIHSAAGFLVAPSTYWDVSKNDTFLFTSEIVGDVKIQLEVAAYKNGEKQETINKELTFRASANPLELTVAPYLPLRTGEETTLNITISKPNYSKEDFKIYYTQTKGVGVLKNGKSKLEPNSSFLVRKDILHSLSYTPDAIGEHIISLNIEVEEGQIIVKTIDLNVSAYINIVVDPIGSAAISGNLIYDKDTHLNITIIPYTNYSFIGWYDGESLITSDPNLREIATKDITYIGKLDFVSFDVVFTSTEGGSISNQGGNYTYNEIVKSSASADEGYSFIGWYDGENLISQDPIIAYTVTSNKSFVAKFKLNTYTISFAANKNGSINNIGGNYNYGEIATSIATAHSKYKFLGWFESNNLITLDPTITVTVGSNRNFIANFAKNTAIISIFSTDPTKGDVIGGGELEIGNTHTVRAVPSEGHHLIGWYENGDKISSSNDYTFTVSNNRTLQARFEINKYQIKLSAFSPFPVSGLGEYTHGAAVSGAIDINLSGQGKVIKDVKSSSPYVIFDKENYTFKILSISEDAIITVVHYDNNNRLYIDNRDGELICTLDRALNHSINIQITYLPEGQIDNLELPANTLNFSHPISISSSAQIDFIEIFPPDLQNKEGYWWSLGGDAIWLNNKMK